MIIVAVWQEIEEVNDPTFSYKLDTPEHFYVIKFKSAKNNITFHLIDL